VPPGRLAAALEGLGVGRGDVLMVHCGGAPVARLGWEPSDLIDFLLDYLGREGTLAMPSHPRLGQHEGCAVYDLRRSPSTVGLPTELFRRRRGVRRSRFPFAAAAAQGRLAETLLADHGRSWAPHDDLSPYARLAELGGRVLCMGVPLTRMTILHVAEDRLRDRLAIPHFYEDRVVRVVGDGAEHEHVVHRRAPWLWWYLHMGRWSFEMRRRGLAREAVLSGVPLRAADASRVVEWMESDIRHGRSLYPLARWNRWLHLGDPMLGQDG
jgi:aminoglycoside 3-N-acetyltransferase